MNPKCKIPFLAYGEGFHDIGGKASAFYSSENKFCCFSCEIECSVQVFSGT
jgi:hypothetical protein